MELRIGLFETNEFGTRLVGTTDDPWLVDACIDELSDGIHPRMKETTGRQKLRDYLANTMTQAFFADECGVDRHTLNHILHGRRIPTIPQAVKIENATKGEVKVADWNWEG